MLEGNPVSDDRDRCAMAASGTSRRGASAGRRNLLRWRGDGSAVHIIDKAIDAMNGKGKLRLLTYSEDNFVVVEIVDNGPGIPEDLQARIFEPFFTTKKVGEGTGLGLDTVQRIVKKHKGTITVDSKPGQTCFQI
jgi:nitrogen fixation/metabolism regulation signal transduction histidine kinase